MKSRQDSYPVMVAVIDDFRTRGQCENIAVDQRAGIEADRAAAEQCPAAQRDQVGRARPRADEMHGHVALGNKRFMERCNWLQYMT